MQLADPMAALVSLQQEVRRGSVNPQPADLARGISVLLDNPNGVVRYTYARIEHGRVKAIAIFVHHEPIDGVPCFNIGYAVPETYRNRGWASEIVEQGIQELRHGLGRHGVKSFYVEAVVGQDNIASQRVATKVISASPIKDTDSESGQPIFAYKRLVEC